MSEFRSSPSVVTELDEAIAWYERQSPEAARRFITAVEAAIDQICDHPGRFPRKSNRYRYARVKRFPYIIVFSVQGDIPTIAAIRHTSRRNADLDY